MALGLDRKQQEGEIGTQLWNSSCTYTCAAVNMGYFLPSGTFSFIERLQKEQGLKQKASQENFSNKMLFL